VVVSAHVGVRSRGWKRRATARIVRAHAGAEIDPRKPAIFVRRPCHGRHGQAIEFAGYTMQMLRDTLENWQSEFLQLEMVHVVRLPE
jgi:hypothetical protein